MNRGQSRQGFTILEVLIVLVVIGVIAAISLVGYTAIQNRSILSKKVATGKLIEQKMEKYYAANGRYPTTYEAAQASDALLKEYVGDSMIVAWNCSDRNRVCLMNSYYNAGADTGYNYAYWDTDQNKWRRVSVYYGLRSDELGQGWNQADAQTRFCPSLSNGNIDTDWNHCS